MNNIVIVCICNISKNNERILKIDFSLSEKEENKNTALQ